MKWQAAILLNTILMLHGFTGNGQEGPEFSGQLSSWLHFNSSNDLPLWSGGRYIPQLNFDIPVIATQLIDFEASANLYGNFGLHPFDTVSFNGKIKPYRIWARFSTTQLELRAGLQKINFGSASILRPLMWFDRIDSRDPLKLTDGVWGLLARYYFLNNVNIWLWGLYGNENPKGWETLKSIKHTPEFGGRLQTPLPRGEAGFSYHHRMADCSSLSDSAIAFKKVPENRFGFDAKFDVVVGCWIEASWSNHSKNIGIYSNQEIINFGIDYTFGLGNGLTVIVEQLIASYDRKPFEFENSTTFSLMTLSYPVGIFDNISAVFYYDWTHDKSYNFVNWQKQFNKFTFYLMGYINPKEYNIPTQGSDQMLYAGNGIQLMVVLNH
ncbi:MAG: hypothetical protein JXA61_03765 [Bacteroidales bacterium]|nr:hypothetical protein [Bacteroidales bacterium]